MKVVLYKLGKVSPILLLFLAYALPLTMAVLQGERGSDVQSSVLLAYPVAIIIWFFSLSTIGLSCWHLTKRRRVAESMLALLLVLPMMFICVGGMRRAMTDHQVGLGVQPDVSAVVGS